MHLDKFCPKCKRTYRGEGYQGVCTSYCFARPVVEKIPEHPGYTYAPQKPYIDKRQEAILKANAKWLNQEYVPYESPKHGSKRKSKYCPNMLVEPSGWGKQYKSVRG